MKILPSRKNIERLTGSLKHIFFNSDAKKLERSKYLLRMHSNLCQVQGHKISVVASSRLPILIDLIFFLFAFSSLNTSISCNASYSTHAHPWHRFFSVPLFYPCDFQPHISCYCCDTYSLALMLE